MGQTVLPRRGWVGVGASRACYIYARRRVAIRIMCVMVNALSRPRLGGATLPRDGRKRAPLVE